MMKRVIAKIGERQQRIAAQFLPLHNRVNRVQSPVVSFAEISIQIMFSISFGGVQNYLTAPDHRRAIGRDGGVPH